MVYPTVTDKDPEKIHIVKDQNYTVCGYFYNKFATFTKEDLKKIHFIKVEKITCNSCTSSFS